MPPFLSNLEVRAVAFSLRDERLCVLLATGSSPSCWLLPGSAVQIEQSFEDAARQKIFDLTGLRETYLEQLYTYGDPGEPGQERLISVVYFALLPAPVGAQVYTQDVEAASWFPAEEPEGLQKSHFEILAYALRRLRYKLEYSAVGFQLLPEYFSLSELQQTYEIILGERLDKRNFRRRILEAGIIEPTSRMRGGEGRPARLYRYRPDAVAEVKTRRLFP
jgi:8-oxo-dGTP diphosphatase